MFLKILFILYDGCFERLFIKFQPHHKQLPNNVEHFSEFLVQHMYYI